MFASRETLLVRAGHWSDSDRWTEKASTMKIETDILHEPPAINFLFNDNTSTTTSS